MQAHVWDEIVEIIDNDKLDPSDRRVKLDGRKWFMSKHAPPAYGDKLTLAGGDPDAPLFKQAVAEMNQMSEPELAALEHFTEADSRARKDNEEG